MQTSNGQSPGPNDGQTARLLRTPLGRLVLKTPILIASGVFGYGEEYLDVRGFSLDVVGGVVLKGVTLKPRIGNRPPRLFETPCGLLNSIGLENLGVEVLVREKLPALRDINTEVFVNVGGETAEEIIDAARELSRHQELFSALELNLSCPNISQRPVGEDAIVASRIVTAVKRMYALPVFAKLVPNPASIDEVARACEEAGVDGLTVANTLPAMAIDIWARRPLLGNNTGGLSGPAVKPLALFLVHRVRRATSIPIIASGGIASARDVMEFVIAGASACSVGTALFYDPGVCSKIAEGIVDFLFRDAKLKGLSSPRPVASYVGSLVLNQ